MKTSIQPPSLAHCGGLKLWRAKEYSPSTAGCGNYLLQPAAQGKNSVVRIKTSHLKKPFSFIFFFWILTPYPELVDGLAPEFLKQIIRGAGHGTPRNRAIR